MSNLANPVECREWIMDWRKEGNPRQTEREFRRALDEQTANLANVKVSRAFAMSLGGGIASWRAEIYSDESIHNYERSVAMLKRAVDSGHYQ